MQEEHETKENQDTPPTNDGKTMEKNPKTPLVERDENGRVKPGSVLNPEGMKPGTKHISSIVRSLLKEIGEGNTEPYEKLLARRVMKKAIVEGNMRAIEVIWAYMDGKPKEEKVLEHHVGDKTLEDLFDEAEAEMQEEDEEEKKYENENNEQPNRPTDGDREAIADSEQAQEDGTVSPQ